MRMRFFFLIILFLICLSTQKFLFAHTIVDKPSNTFAINDEERRELSECIANILWTYLSNYSPHYDIKVVLSRLEELSKSHATPMSPIECRMTYLLPLLDKINAYEAAENLKAAEEFLVNLSKKEGIVEVVKGKLFYEQLQLGEGSFITMNDSPTLHYEESWLNHAKPHSIQRDTKITLSETIRGFAQGVEGMRVGERRKIYVHPDLAYGKIGKDSPQQLAIFEVMVIDK